MPHNSSPPGVPFTAQEHQDHGSETNVFTTAPLTSKQATSNGYTPPNHIRAITPRKAAHMNFRTLPPAIPDSKAFATMMSSNTSTARCATHMDVHTHAAVTSWLDSVVAETWTPAGSVEAAVLQAAA